MVAEKANLAPEFPEGAVVGLRVSGMTEAA